jgi:hypothetical protein
MFVIISIFEQSTARPQFTYNTDRIKRVSLPSFNTFQYLVRESMRYSLQMKMNLDVKLFINSQVKNAIATKTLRQKIFERIHLFQPEIKSKRVRRSYFASLTSISRKKFLIASTLDREQDRFLSTVLLYL